MSKVVDRLQAAAIDGRAHTIRYRQRALGQLHKALVSQTENLIEAINSDSRQTQIESRVEVLLAISCVREHYTGLSLESALKEEYAVARNEDNLAHRSPRGLVCIRPCRHTLLYSVLSPLSAAIAAGNCVILYLERDLSALNTLLHELLRSAIDKDLFGIIDREVDLKLTAQHFHVLQNGGGESTESRLSSPSGRVIAIVDRTADVDIAARALVMARFGFGGTSDYAPDLVLVNEFVKKPFMEAAMKYTFQRQAIDFSGKGSKQPRGGHTQLLNRYDNDPTAEVLSVGSNGAIVELLERNSPHFTTKLREKILQMHPIRSLDDAIDLSNRSGEMHLACYSFASPKAAKYLAQFVRSRSVFVSHIPPELLVGPSCPTMFPVNLKQRYTTDMFQSPSPQFVRSSKFTKFLGSCLANESSSSTSKVMGDWRTAVEAPISADPQPPGGAIGFFEQGIITGTSVAFAPIAIGVASGLFYCGRYAFAHMDWRRVAPWK